MTSDGQRPAGGLVLSTSTDPRFGVLNDGRLIVHLTANDTDGRLGMWETFPPAGAGPRAHTHTRETEFFHVVAGTFRVWCGDEEYTAGPSTAVALPPGIRHRWQNIGDGPGHLLAFVAPGGFEAFILEQARMRSPAPAELQALEERFGILGRDVDRPPAT